MRALTRAVAVAALIAACEAAPGAVAGPPASHAPPVVVVQSLPGKNPLPASGRQAVALARARENVPRALARPYRAELGWVAQWQGDEWWLVGVFESDWGVRFVVRASVRGRHVEFGAGPTRQWVLANARPSVTTLFARLTPAAAVAQMQAEMLAVVPPGPNTYPNFDPTNYTILDGAATLVRDEPEGGSWGSGPGWWFVYYARDHRTGQNVVLPVTGPGYDPPVPEGSVPTSGGGSVYRLGDFWVRNDVEPAVPALNDWIDSVIAARGWQPADWPSTGHDFTFFSIPPFFQPPPAVIAREAGGARPHPATARAAVAVAAANLDIPDLLAEPFSRFEGWTAQWRRHQWWLVGVFRSDWGKRFVVPARVVGNDVRFGVGPRQRWILKHARPRVGKSVYTRLTPSSAAALLKSEILTQPTPQFDPSRYTILAGAAKLVRDVDSGPAWFFIYYAKALATGKDVVLPVTSPAHYALVETTYDTSTPGRTAYGFKQFDVLLKVPSNRPRLAKWIRGVVARRHWHPANFH